MHIQDTGQEIDVTLYARSSLPPPIDSRLKGFVNRLRGIETDEAIGDVVHTRWPNRVNVGECDQDIRDTYLEFEEWASCSGRELSPFFGTRECYAAGTRTPTKWIVLPVFCLTIRRNDSLHSVYPHRKASTHYSVEDAITLLEHHVTTTPSKVPEVPGR